MKTKTNLDNHTFRKAVKQAAHESNLEQAKIMKTNLVVIDRDKFLKDFKKEYKFADINPFVQEVAELFEKHSTPFPTAVRELLPEKKVYKRKKFKDINKITKADIFSEGKDIGWNQLRNQILKKLEDR